MARLLTLLKLISQFILIVEIGSATSLDAEIIDIPWVRKGKRFICGGPADISHAPQGVRFATWQL